MVLFSINLSNPRFWAGTGILLTCALGVTWFFSPGLPVLIGPWATASSKAMGQDIFEHEWQPGDSLAGGDGVGPVFNAQSCVACHFQGGVGGGGDNSHNVRAFEVMPTANSRTVKSGVVHKGAIDLSLKESDKTVHDVFPVIKGGRSTFSNCSIVLSDFDPVVFEDVNSTALFGAGWIDCIPEKALTSNRLGRMTRGAAKEIMADFSDVPIGRLRILPDGRIGKFGWKGQAATLEEFVASACSNELGLGTPSKEQAKPLGCPDYPSAAPDLNRKQFKSLVAFVSTLPRPVEIKPTEPAARDQAAKGKELFTAIGCATCHVPDMGGVKGVYSDFMLYTLEDEIGDGSGGYGSPASPQFPLPEDHPRPSEWKTPALWGVADSAPYMHDGSSPTLQDAIMRHRRDAKSVLDRYNKLCPKEQQALLAFLMTLKAPQDAAPLAKK
jgi:mono/diheme cytochrome c family protein